jgi:hypothetical protein
MNFPQDQFKIQNQSYTNPYFVNRNVGQNQEMLCCESDDNLPNLREETSNKYDDLENELMKAKEEEEYRRWDDDDEPNKNIFEFKEINILSANIKENPFLNPKGMDVLKEENIQPIFHLFTKKPDDQIDYIKEYSETPTFKDFNLINDDEERKDNKRKFNMDNMSKKVRQKISSKLVEIFGDELKKLSFKKFNQDGNSIKNKNYLNMSVKEFLINILLENINKNTTINNDYILTKVNEKFIESLANDDERLKFILNMKMEDIYNEFFDSKEYQDLIKELIEQKNDYYYIHLFIKKNKNFVEYYKNAKERTNENN